MTAMVLLEMVRPEGRCKAALLRYSVETTIE